MPTGLKLFLGFLTLVSLASCVVAIILLTERVSTSYWLNTLMANELIEADAPVLASILNSKNQFLGADASFGTNLAAWVYDGQQLSCQGRYLARARNGTFAVVDAPVHIGSLRLQYSAGNNRGFVVWLEHDKRFWLTEALTWVSSMPRVRPFTFLFSEKKL